VSFMRREIHGTEVIGVEIDGETRCAHYHGERDIVAIKFKCCGNWFPCHQCHAELADHSAIVWPQSEFDLPAILCGGCGCRLTIRDYLQGNSSCPRCKSAFNPGCAHHHHLYFENVHSDA
jgi:uncharacterized CHY-type Zn-finger protein